jgi:SIR2-like domain
MEAINPIPALPAGLREAALKGTLVPFVGAGASVLAGCPNWSNFADAALLYFVRQGKFSHGQLAQLSHQSPRVKLSIALGLQREHKLPIDFVDILYPRGRNTDPKGRKLYDALCKLGKTFVTTNYDDWLGATMGAPAPPPPTETKENATSPIRQKTTVIYKVAELTLDNLERPNRVFHLHGSLLDPTSMILTTQHYVTHYANDRRGGNSPDAENKVLTFLGFLFAEKNVLFVGYGLEELEILEYVIVKARIMAEPGRTEMRHFLLQGFFSHEVELARSLTNYYAECGIELVPFLRDQKDWDQLIEVLEEFARIAPAGSPLTIQVLKEMEALLE